MTIKPEKESDKKKIQELQKEVSTLKEKLIRKDETLTTLFSNLGHEIRTPLNGILGFSEVLKMGERNKEDMEYYVDLIVESSEMLVSIIRDALDISKIESGRYYVYPEEFDLNDKIFDVYSTYKDAAEEKGLQLFVENMISEEFIISSSPETVIKVLSKLIDNAIKFTKSGWIKISYEENGSFIEFRVEDTGIGIAESIQSNLFTRFIDIEVSNSRKVSGTGLDLTLCHGLVKLLGGEIEYISKKEKGSIFSFSIFNHQK